MLITRARMLLNKTVFEAEVLIQDKYTVYAGILDLGWSESNLELSDFNTLEYYDYLRIFNVPYASSGHGDNDEGESFRSALPEAERKEIYELCKKCLKKVWQNDRTVLKAGEWNDGQWQNIHINSSNYQPH